MKYRYRVFTGNIGDNIMKTFMLRKNMIGKIFAILVFSFFFLAPGHSLADSSYWSTDDPPLKPAYIENEEDLVDVQVVYRPSSFQPFPPTASNGNIIELLQQLNESLILGYLENITAFGPRLSGTEACDQAGRYLYETFQDMDLTVRYHNYTDSVVSGSNIEATLYGTDSTNIFIICAHYDSVAAGPGADDDGSGVAAVLAAAKIMRNYEFSHTVRFVCFSGEEQGLIGSHHYAKDAYNDNDSIIAVLNADMIGFAPSYSDSITGKIFTNDQSTWIVEFTLEISKLYSDYINIELIRMGQSSGSDHYSFWQYGYDAVFYHEYNFNDYYHSADDTIDNMNVNYSTRFSRLILATLAELALQPRPVLAIKSISGGIGITAQVTNIGDLNASDVHVTMLVTGGLFRFINSSSSSETALLKPQETLPVKAMLLRFGAIRISVTATASNAEQVTKRATAFLLGPFVRNIVINP
jgi:aminopeptidase YwaD